MNRKVLPIALIMFAILASRMVMTPTMQSIRSVDITLIFAAGMAAGVLAVALVQMFREKKTTS